MAEQRIEPGSSMFQSLSQSKSFREQSKHVLWPTQATWFAPCCCKSATGTSVLALLLRSQHRQQHRAHSTNRSQQHAALHQLCSANTGVVLVGGEEELGGLRVVWLNPSQDRVRSSDLHLLYSRCRSKQPIGTAGAYPRGKGPILPKHSLCCSSTARIALSVIKNVFEGMFIIVNAQKVSRSLFRLHYFPLKIENIVREDTSYLFIKKIYTPPFRLKINKAANNCNQKAEQ